MGTVHDLTAKRDSIRDANLAASKAKRDELSDKIGALHDQVKRGRAKMEDVAPQIEELRSARDALRDANKDELDAAELLLSAARRAEKDSAAQALKADALKACMGMSEEQIAAIELAERTKAAEATSRADAIASHLNDLRCDAEADKQAAALSPKQRAQMAAALERAAKAG